MKKIIIEFIATFITGIAIAAVAGLILFAAMEKVVERYEKSECHKWQAEAKQYTGYYLTEWQEEQCNHYGIKIDAKVLK